MKDLIQKYLGKQVDVKIGGLIVTVKVLDVKRAYGKTRFLITPVKGSGEIWTEKID